MAGTLYLCATPIGNLEDITLRVLKTLREVDLIAAEDTRRTIQLLNHFEIRTPMTSYHEFNKTERAPYLTERLLLGMNVALVTDAGTPAVSDPGEELVRQCWEAGIRVTSLPGPTAGVTALTLSGLSTRRFCFEGFLPSGGKERRWVLEELKTESRTILLYEAPHRLARTLRELLDALGDRRMTLCRELTKRYEEIWRTTLSEALEHFQTSGPRGEYVIVLEGRGMREQLLEKVRSWEDLSIEEHMEYYRSQGLPDKEAMRMVARDRGISRRDVYRCRTERKSSP